MIPQPPDFGDFTIPITVAAIRFVLIVVDIFLVLGTFYALYKAWGFRPYLDTNTMPTKRVLTLQSAAFQERWQKLLTKFQMASPESVRLAIIEADALVDEALRQMGVPGDHMADRLSQFSPEEMTTLNDLWNAHRFRNEIVHTPGFSVSSEDATRALTTYEAFLKELGVLP